MKEYLEQRIAYIFKLSAPTVTEKIVYECLIDELKAALNHLNNIKEE